jgi:hypothetical protein
MQAPSPPDDVLQRKEKKHKKDKKRRQDPADTIQLELIEEPVDTRDTSASLAGVDQGDTQTLTSAATTSPAPTAPPQLPVEPVSSQPKARSTC